MILAALLTAAPAVLVFVVALFGVGEASLVRLARRSAPTRCRRRPRRPRPVFLRSLAPLAAAAAGRAPPPMTPVPT